VLPDCEQLHYSKYVEGDYRNKLRNKIESFGLYETVLQAYYQKLTNHQLWHRYIKKQTV